MATGAIVARILTQYSDKGSKQAQKDIKKLGADFDKFAKQSFRAFGLATAAFAGFATKIGIDSIKAASDIQQQFGALDAVFGKNSKNLQDFSRSMVEYGLSTADAARYAALLGTQLKGLGLSEEDAIDRTKTLQVLAADLAATYGGTTADAVQALSSTFKGEYNPIERYGVAIKKSDINARVAAKGLGKLEGDLLKAAEAQTAFEMIIAKTTAAQGQAIREYDTVAAQLQRLDASYMNIKASLGLALLPVVQEFAGYLLSDVLPRIQEWVDLNKDELSEGLRSATVFLRRLLEGALAFGQWVTDNTGKIKLLAGIIAGMFVANKVAAFIVSLNTIVATLAVLRTTAIGTGIALAFATAGSSALTAATALAAVGITALVTKRYMDFNAKSTDKVTKSTKGLTGSTKANIGVTNSATTAINKYNSSTSNLTEKQKKALEEEKKLIEVRKQIKEQFGITTAKGEDDSIQLEAARLNLIKQQALGIEAVSQKILESLNLQLSNNLAAQRYADILTIIEDKKITTAEVEALALKWGKSKEFVIAYIEKVTGINDIKLDKDFGADAAYGWQKAIDKLKEYLKLLANLTTTTTEEKKKFEPHIGPKGGIGGTTISPTVSSNQAVQSTFEKVFTDMAAMGNTQTQSAVLALSSARYEALGQSYGYNTGGGSVTVNVNAGNVVGSKEELVETVRQGILASQVSGKIIQLEKLGI
jgi:hypothetical protein